MIEKGWLTSPNNTLLAISHVYSKTKCVMFFSLWGFFIFCLGGWGVIWGFVLFLNGDLKCLPSEVPYQQHWPCT